MQKLKKGENVGMSIEGQRSLDGRLSPYKKGAAVIAIDAQCDIVPFMTHGEYLLWPRGAWTVLDGGTIDVKVYPRISTAGLTYADRDQLTEQLKSLAEAEISQWKNENCDYIAHMNSRRGKPLK